MALISLYLRVSELFISFLSSFALFTYIKFFPKKENNPFQRHLKMSLQDPHEYEWTVKMCITSRGPGWSRDGNCILVHTAANTRETTGKTRKRGKEENERPDFILSALPRHHWFYLRPVVRLPFSLFFPFLQFRRPTPFRPYFSLAFPPFFNLLPTSLLPSSRALWCTFIPRPSTFSF